MDIFVWGVGGCEEVVGFDLVSVAANKSTSTGWENTLRTPAKYQITLSLQVPRL